MWQRLSRGAIGAVLCGLIWSASATALTVPAAPSLDRPIVDQTGTLSEQDVAKLSAQIAQSRETKSYQIGILMIPTLGSDEYLEGYSLKVARQWGAGDKASDNGVLVLIVKDDRKMRIEVGRGLEGDLTDTRASRIIRDVMAPAFRNGDFPGGLSAAIDSIQKAVSMQADPKLATASTSNSSDAESWIGLFFFALTAISFVLSWLGSMLARSKSWWAGGVIGMVVGLGLMSGFSMNVWSIAVALGVTVFGFLFDFLVSRNYASHKERGTLPSWWAGGGSIGGSGGSGGGFSGGGSFGGGGFSGGGSSGSW